MSAQTSSWVAYSPDEAAVLLTGLRAISGWLRLHPNQPICRTLSRERASLVDAKFIPESQASPHVAHAAEQADAWLMSLWRIKDDAVEQQAIEDAFIDGEPISRAVREAMLTRYGDLLFPAAQRGWSAAAVADILRAGLTFEQALEASRSPEGIEGVRTLAALRGLPRTRR